MEIRPLISTDFEGLYTIVKEIYLQCPSSMWFARIPDETSFKVIFDSKISRIKAEQIVDLVAVEKGKIIGECEIVRIDGLHGIIGLIILPNHQRAGIGSALLKEAAEKALEIGINSLVAEVSDKNDIALNFFHKSGFLESMGTTKKQGIIRLERPTGLH